MHPGIIEAYMDRSLVKTLKRQTEKELRGRLHRLSSEEAAVLALLQQRMEQQLRRGGKPRTSSARGSARRAKARGANGKSQHGRMRSTARH